MEYEETFTAFVDFLGFSEISRELDEPARLKVLELLRTLVDLRSEFSASATQRQDGSTQYYIRPAISTFSDHIVISFGMKTLRETVTDTSPIWFLVLPQFTQLMSIVASQALRLGFLIRGGATIGKLYHSKGVVFGEALVDAVHLEEHTAIYPRIVLSSAAVREFGTDNLFVKREEDGLYCVDYIRHMIFRSAPPRNTWTADITKWLDEVVVIIQAALDLHARSGNLNKLSKWTWFAKRFRAAIVDLPQQFFTGISASSEARLRKFKEWG